MLQFSAKILFKKSFSKGSVNDSFFRFPLNLHRIPKVNFSTTKTVNGVEYFEGIISRPLMATPNDSTVLRNLKDFSGKMPDDVWLSKAKQEEFSSYFSDINDALAAKAASFSPLDNGKRIQRILEHVIPGGNNFPGVMIAETYKILTPQHKRTPENLKLAYYLGWCYEVVMESFNLADDIFDESQTRRDRICWYQLPDVGPRAVNDTLMIEIAGYYLLRKYFGNLECYTRLLKLINEFTFQVCIGQNLDVDVSKHLDKLTFDTYREIIGTTTLYVVGYNPIALGMTLAGYTDLHVLKEAKSIIADINYLYIVQNDFYDSFGDPKVMGKVTSDIKKGRCRWPAVVAMKLASPDQKEIMKRNYGREDPECEAKVIELYKELNLPQIYDDYCNSVCNRLHEDIEKLKNEDMKKICEKLIEAVMYSIYKEHPAYL